MKTIKLKTLEIKIAESLFELSVEKWKQFQQASLLDIHSSTNIAGIQQKYSKLSAFIQSGMKQEAVEELNNIMVSAHLILNGIDTIQNAFYFLLVEVANCSLEGKNSDEEITDILARLSQEGLTMDMVSDTLDQVKKKFLTR